MFETADTIGQLSNYCVVALERIALYSVILFEWLCPLGLSHYFVCCNISLKRTAEVVHTFVVVVLSLTYA